MSTLIKKNNKWLKVAGSGVPPVDVVEEDNMNPVTSNAVANAFGNIGSFIHCGLPEYTLSQQTTQIMSTVNVPKGTWLLIGASMSTTAEEIKLVVTGDGATLSTGTIRASRSSSVVEYSSTVIGVAKFTNDINKVGLSFVNAEGTCNGDDRYWYVNAIRIA